MTDMTAPVALKRPPILTLVLLAAVAPLAMNMFVPSMPSISADLDAPYTVVQLGLSAYLVGIALLQLVIGPLSDRFGRRPVLIAGMIIFLAGTAISIAATNVTVFLIGRLIQTTSATGLVLSRAIIRDVYPREKSASMIGYVVMGMAIAPMIGPAIGGYIDGVAGWRASFGALGVFGAVVLAASIFTLAETNTRSGQSLAGQVEAWKALAKMRLFWLYAVASGLTSGVFFAFLGGGPAVSTVHLGQTPFQYGVWFALCAAGYAVGNYLSGRLSESRGIDAMMRDGALVCLVGPVLALILFLSGVNAPWALFVPLALVGVGNGMVLPNNVAAAISLRPDAAGAASGLAGAMQMGLGAVGSFVAAAVVGENGSPLALTAFMAMVAIAALLVNLWAIAKSRDIETG